MICGSSLTDRLFAIAVNGKKIGSSRAIFAAMDRDNSGTLDIREFTGAMVRCQCHFSAMFRSYFGLMFDFSVMFGHSLVVLWAHSRWNTTETVGAGSDGAASVRLGEGIGP